MMAITTSVLQTKMMAIMTYQPSKLQLDSKINTQKKSLTSILLSTPWKSIPIALASMDPPPLLLAKTRKKLKRNSPSKTSTSSTTKRKEVSTSTKTEQTKDLGMGASLPYLKVLLS